MKRILIADDDKKITHGLSVRLRNAGYEVWVAHKGADVINLVRSTQPDLVLLDIWMPGMGFQIAQTLTDMGLDVPVIFLTASRKPSLWAQAQEVGAAAFVQKPYDPDELLRIVNGILSPLHALDCSPGL